ncbi:MAG: hypothetical protein R2874_14755 [Desulfobacterales bacterium]
MDDATGAIKCGASFSITGHQGIEGKFKRIIAGAFFMIKKNQHYLLSDQV